MEKILIAISPMQSLQCNSPMQSDQLQRGGSDKENKELQDLLTVNSSSFLKRATFT